MKTRPGSGSKPRGAKRRRKPTAKRKARAAAPAWTPPPGSTMSRSEVAWINRLLKKGHIVVGPDFGKPLDPDDELLKPGPPCRGAVDALIKDRNEGL